MAVFRIGQKARFVLGYVPTNGVENTGGKTRHGAEILITGIVPGFLSAPHGDGIGYFYDHLRIDDCLKKSLHHWAFDYQLEPIQPEGYKVVTWAECPWQPKREEQTA